jgi:hypothetical protein
MAALAEKYGEFGHFVNRQTGEITQSGSAAGVGCIACLARGFLLTGNERYLKAACQTAEFYYEKFVRTGRLSGGPLDIIQAPDSESTALMVESFMSLYEAAGEEKYLRYAGETADILSTWTLAYDGQFPATSTLGRLGIQTVGGIMANAQNHHIGPSTATGSLECLLRLYRRTGETRYLRLLEDIATCLPQYVCPQDGYMPGMLKGMMTEQINLCDELSAPGEFWAISASWGQTNVLLTRAELPSVYIDLPRRTFATFDHLQVTVDFSNQKCLIQNPTPYPAECLLRLDKGESVENANITLNPQEQKEFSWN